MLLRNIYHYWFHIEEVHAISQQLGQSDLPEYVGEMANACYYRESFACIIVNIGETWQ
jgi:hypothetical protein